MITRTSSSRMRRDAGAAMVMVLVWTFVLLALSTAIAMSVRNNIPRSDHSEYSYAALAAAEAGIVDYRARLTGNPTYYAKDDPTNPALSGWAPVPGGNSDAEFSYVVDATKAGVGGGITLYVTGRSHDVTRTLEAVLARRSTLDYVYMSDIESTAPYMPAAYSTTPGSGGTDATGKSLTGQQLADLLCARHWWDYAPPNTRVSPTGSGNQRNQNYCQWATISSGEVLQGRVHSNDVWRLANTSLTGTIQANGITSSCPSNTAEGLVTGAANCPSAHRFIDDSGTGTTSTLLGTNTINGNYKAWNGTTNAYQGDAWRPAGTDNTGRNPRWDSVLELPPDPDLMVKHASDTGCIYTGPTRIRFAVESGLGYMYVTSPDTKSTSPACAGGTASGLFGAPASGNGDKTAKVALAQFTDLVIYVQAVPRAATPDDPDNAYDAANVWADGVEPTCVYNRPVVSTTGTVGTITGSASPWTATISGMSKTTGLVVGSTISATNGTGSIGSGGAYAVKTVSTNSITFTATGGTKPTAGSVTSISTAFKYPYVTPNDLVDPPFTNGFTSGKSLNQGFPSELSPVDSPFFGSSCASGDVYLQGSYKGQVTLATDNNVIVTSNLLAAEQKSGTTNGEPDPASTSVLGLVSNQFTYVYRPLVADSVYVADWGIANQTNVKINAAILAVNQCLCSQREYSSGSSSLYIWGSLAQKYRCPVGQPGTITGGYSKQYRYDPRLARQTPPYMVELSYEPWLRSRFGEVTPLEQSVGATTWPLLDLPKDSGAVVSAVQAVDGPVTAVQSGTSVVVTATAPGLATVKYDVTKNSVTETRHLVVMVS